MTTPSVPIPMAMLTTARAITRTNRSMRATSGGCAAGREEISSANFPTAVAIPVAVITAVPLPEVTIEPASTASRLPKPDSPGPSPAPSAPQVSFATGSDSPVSNDSSTCRPVEESSLASAGIRLPDSIQTRSPGTNSSAETSRSLPSRTTAARILRSFSIARLVYSACCSCQAPMAASMAMATAMNAASWASPNASDTAAAAERISTSGLAN